MRVQYPKCAYGPYYQLNPIQNGRRNLTRSLISYSKVKCKANFVLLGSKESNAFDVKVLPSDHREDDKSCAWPFYSVVKVFSKAL